MSRPKKEKPNRADGLYEVKITIGRTLTGKNIRKSFYSRKSKADAKRQAEEWMVEQRVAEETCGFAIQKEYSFSDWAYKWLEVYKKDSVRATTYYGTYVFTVENILNPYFHDVPLTAIRPADIKLFYDQSAKKLSDSALKKARLCLNSIFETAIDNELCFRNPARNVPVTASKIPSKERQVLSGRDCQIVYQFAKTHKYGTDILLLLELGLRKSELLGLQWDDIDLEQNIIFIRRSVTEQRNSGMLLDKPKTASSFRELPLSQTLSDYLRQLPRIGKYIISKSNTPLRPSNWDHRHYNVFWDDLQKEHPEIQKITPHEMRHTCGTLLYDKTHDIYAVSKFLGHSGIDITSKIYVHNNADMLRDALRI